MLYYTFVYRYYASYFALPYSKAVGKSLRQHVFALSAHMFALSVRYFGVSLLFFLLKLHFARFLYSVHFIRLLLIIVYFPTFNHLAPFYYMSVGQVSHSLQSYLIAYRTKIIKIIKTLPTWTPPNRLRIRT